MKKKQNSTGVNRIKNSRSQKKTVQKHSSIKEKISKNVVTLVIILSVVLGITGIALTYITTITTLNTTITETAKLTAGRVSLALNAHIKVAGEIGQNPVLSDPNTTRERKEEILKNKIEYYNYNDVSLINTKGIGFFDEKSYTDKIYFQKSMSGETYISDPIKDEATGKLSYILSAPLWKNGNTDSAISGVISIVPNDNILNDIVSSIKIGQKGFCYLIDNHGNAIAHSDISNVGTNLLSPSQTSGGGNSKVAHITEKMVSLKTGADSFYKKGKPQIIGYAPVPDTNGWSVGVVVAKNEFISGSYISAGLTILITLLFVFIGIISAKKLGAKIADPVGNVVERLHLLSVGDLTTAVPVSAENDEISALSDSLRGTIDKLQFMIKNISDVLGEVAEGNLTVSIEQDYAGDFEKLAVSIRSIISSLNNTVQEINQNAEQVASGSNQITSTSTALAEGAADQASTVEQLTATIADITEQVKHNAANASTANEKATVSSKSISDNYKQMHELIKAIHDIKTSSDKISDITKTIEDIAEQTNLLSLNAAIEAARAGESGKGFAVVASEVRSLAAKSSEAVRNTALLIEDSIQAVEKGSSIAYTAANSLESVVASITDVSSLIDGIATASKAQSISLEEISLAINQISSVTESNSASAEESSAFSLELYEKAARLKKLVDTFKI